MPMRFSRRPKHVLIVDDDRTLDLESLFEKAGMRPVRVYDCESALEYLIDRSEKGGPLPLAAVVDMALPVARTDQTPQPLAGLGLMEEIKKISPSTKLVPITGRGWSMNGNESYDVLERSGEIGMAGWITKPASSEKIERLVRCLRPKPFAKTWFEFKQPVSRQKQLFLGALAFLLPLVLWYALTRFGMINPIFLPSPGKVMADLTRLVIKGEFLFDIGASVFRVMAAFVLAAAVAIPLGILMGSFGPIAAFVNPFCAFVRYMPASAFIPLIILWLGIGHSQKIAVIFLGVFFYLLVLIAACVAEVRTEFIETAYTLGASRRQVLFRVVSPAALPGILESLRAMIGAAWTFLIAAELVAAQVGIGYRIIEAQRFLQTGVVIAGILVIGIIGILTDLGFRILSRLVSPWKE
jgi:NitT/TauT family transport system permease protein